MFIINEVKKKTRTGGKGLCKVFYIENNTIEHVTEMIADQMGLEYSYGAMIVHYGSGTGAMRIQEYLKATRGNDIQIHNVSVF